MHGLGGQRPPPGPSPLRRHALFASHGAPLILKSDNGSHFKGEVPELLAQRGVAHLLSPILTPTYNGACEAAIGNLKARTHEFACRADHPEYWDLDDLEGAKLQTNEAKLRRKRAFAFDDPELYHCRKPWEKIPESNGKSRAAFAAAWAEEKHQLRKEATWGKNTNQEPLSSQDEATIRRKAACFSCRCRGPRVRCVRSAGHQEEAMEKD